VGDFFYEKQFVALPHAPTPEALADWERRASQEALIIRVSDMPDWRYEALVAVHELVEAILCRNDGVSEPDAIKPFDIEFETARETQADDGRSVFEFRGRVVGIDEEPGDDPDAPYQKQHNFATAVERMLCAALNVKWDAYCEANLALDR
jgi:hypothetical protein